MFWSRTDHDRLKNQRERAVLQPDAFGENGKPELWFDVGVDVPKHGAISMPWQGTDPDDVRDSLIQWFNDNEWITTTAEFNGSRRKLTFRSSWVSGFTIGEVGGKRRAAF